MQVRAEALGLRWKYLGRLLNPNETLAAAVEDMQRIAFPVEAGGNSGGPGSPCLALAAALVGAPDQSPGLLWLSCFFPPLFCPHFCTIFTGSPLADIFFAAALQWVATTK